MKLNAALQAAAAARQLPVGERMFLVCGFEPLHLPTFLRAHYAAREPGRSLEVLTGLYGDLEGNLERARASQASAAAVVVEWADLDPRLGLRAIGGFSFARQAEILSSVADRLGRLEEGVRRLSEHMPVALARPSLEFSLIGHTHGWHYGALELALEQALLGFMSTVSQEPRVRLMHPVRLARESPLASRHDARAELATGFPYRLEHASLLAHALLELAYLREPKKGLITDLDDTLWAGLVGEVGASEVAWSIERRAQVHGLYQSVLEQLQHAGVLLAVASKNEPEVVARALARQDLRLDRAALFPIEASWGAKSAAVSRILNAWNIAADAVVVVDDSRMELEEIQSRHPGVTCLEFRAGDPEKVLGLCDRLRDLFGKPVVLEEDRLRGASLRTRTLFEEQKAAEDTGSFLRSLAGKITFDERKNADDARLLTLINKTNQFNLNGLRVSEAEWLRLLADDSSFVLGASYLDRYGALGTIGVAAGTLSAEGVDIKHWVLSCRAFSRRIEDHMLQRILQLSGAGRVRVFHQRTEKNGPFVEFLERLGASPGPDGVVISSRSALLPALEGLPHTAEGAIEEP